MPTLLPSAIVSQSGLYGSLAALADDPADPDELWLTVTESEGVTVSWTAPTNETIVAYRLEWGTVIDDEWGYFVNSVLITGSPPPTSYTFVDEMPAGTYAFRVTAIDDDGEESDPTYLGVFTIP
jgi:hypothetical protein